MTSPFASNNGPAKGDIIPGGLHSFPIQPEQSRDDMQLDGPDGPRFTFENDLTSIASSVEASLLEPTPTTINPALLRIDTPEPASAIPQLEVIAPSPQSSNNASDHSVFDTSDRLPLYPSPDMEIDEVTQNPPSCAESDQPVFASSQSAPLQEGGISSVDQHPVGSSVPNQPLEGTPPNLLMLSYLNQPSWARHEDVRYYEAAPGQGPLLCHPIMVPAPAPQYLAGVADGTLPQIQYPPQFQLYPGPLPTFYNAQSEEEVYPDFGSDGGSDIRSGFRSIPVSVAGPGNGPAWGSLRNPLFAPMPMLNPLRRFGHGFGPVDGIAPASRAIPCKRKQVAEPPPSGRFTFAKPVNPKGFVANPENRPRWLVGADNHLHYQNGPLAKRLRATA